MQKGLRVVQINLNHSWGAHNLLQQYMKEKEIDLALITEPIYILEKNWIGSKDKEASICWKTDMGVRVREVVRGKEYVGVKLGKVVFISCYIPSR